jgi:hypothetical protein
MKNENLHNMDLHEAIRMVERHYDCIIYGVLDIESVEHDLAYFKLFEEGVLNLSSIPKTTLVHAMHYAYDSVDSESDNYSYILELCYKYIVDALTKKCKDCEWGDLVMPLYSAVKCETCKGTGRIAKKANPLNTLGGYSG